MKVFIGVDLQRDFMYPNGALYVKESENILDNIYRAHTRLAGSKLILTLDSHTKDSAEISDTPDFIDTFPPHCMENTRGADLIREVDNMIDGRIPHCGYVSYDTPADKLTMASNVIFIKKDNVSAFANNPNVVELFTKMMANDVIEFFVFGVATEFCVKAMVEGLYGLIQKMPDKSKYSITVIKDMIAGINNEKCGELFKVWETMGIRFDWSSFLNDAPNVSLISEEDYK